MPPETPPDDEGHDEQERDENAQGGHAAAQEGGQAGREEGHQGEVDAAADDAAQALGSRESARPVAEDDLADGEADASGEQTDGQGRYACRDRLGREPPAPAGYGGQRESEGAALELGRDGRRAEGDGRGLTEVDAEERGEERVEVGAVGVESGERGEGRSREDDREEGPPHRPQGTDLDPLGVEDGCERHAQASWDWAGAAAAEEAAVNSASVAVRSR